MRITSVGQHSWIVVAVYEFFFILNSILRIMLRPLSRPKMVLDGDSDLSLNVRDLHHASSQNIEKVGFCPRIL